MQTDTLEEEKDDVGTYMEGVQQDMVELEESLLKQINPNIFDSSPSNQCRWPIAHKNKKSQTNAEDRRCKRSASLFYPGFCTQHGRKIFGVFVKKSTIPNAGLGLFADMDFAEGDLIALYTGQVLDPVGFRNKYDTDHHQQESESGNNKRKKTKTKITQHQQSHNGMSVKQCDYCLEIPKSITDLAVPLIVDASDPNSGVARFINDAKTDNPQQALHNNTKFVFTRGPSGHLIPAVVSLEPISGGTELFVDYGQHSFWS